MNIKKNLLVILARGGSKRIPNKNIRKVNGIPLVCHSVINAKKTKIFDRIHVSTDSKKIKKIVERYGVKIDFLRPDKLSGDNIATIPVVKYVVDTYYIKFKIKYENIFILSAINPFIKKNDIINAFKFYLKMKKPVLGVCEYPAPIEWAFSLDIKKSNKLTPHKNNFFLKRSQDIKKSYYDSGAFSIHNIIDIKNTKLGYDNKFLGYKLTREKSIDIDTLDDLKYVKKLFKNI